MTEESTKLLAYIRREIKAAADILEYEDGQPCTFVESWEIERAFDGLTNVLMLIDVAMKSGGAP